MNKIDFREIAAMQDNYKRITVQSDRKKVQSEFYSMADTLMGKYGIAQSDAYAIISSLYSLTETIKVIDAADKPEADMSVFVVQTSWADEENFSNDSNVSKQAFLSVDAAKAALKSIVETERREGLIERWFDDENFREEISEEEYSCWLDGDYCFNHLEVSIEEVKIC